MKIAIVVSTLKAGGMERVAVNLADAYHELGHETHLIYLKNRPPQLLPTNNNIPVHLFNLKKESFLTIIGLFWYFICKIINIFVSGSFPIFFAYIQSFIFAKKLKQLEKDNKFDFVIFRGQGTFEQIWPIKDQRFVFVRENISNKNKYGMLSKNIFNKLYADRHIACVSNGVLDDFLEVKNEHAIQNKSLHQINNPINIGQIKTASQENVATHDKPYILGLGRLVPQKNFSLLVEAYSILKNRHNIHQDLVIVGNGRDIDNIKQKVRELDLIENVHFKGLQLDPYPWYKQSDLFVLSSKHEGLGMVLIEALASGTRIISTDSKGGVRTIMNGYFEQFLAEETPESLAERMLFALNTPNDEQYQMHASQTLNEFDGKEVAQKFISTYL
ncbi:MAG: glycosyltransferase [Vibrio sp.]